MTPGKKERKKGQSLYMYLIILYVRHPETIFRAGKIAGIKSEWKEIVNEINRKSFYFYLFTLIWLSN